MKPEALTIREQQVLKLIASGASTREIASGLSLSIKTVEKHRGSLKRKLKLRGIAALTIYAIEYGYLIVQRRY